MITALLSFLGGNVFRMIFGEVVSWLNKKQDHAHGGPCHGAAAALLQVGALRVFVRQRPNTQHLHRSGRRAQRFAQLLRAFFHHFITMNPHHTLHRLACKAYAWAEKHWTTTQSMQL